MSAIRAHPAFTGIVVLLTVVFLGALWLPARNASARTALFVIPPGSAGEIEQGGGEDILPRIIHLALDDKDTLAVRNDDSEPVTIASIILGPGQSFVQRFDQPGTYDFECSLHPVGGLTVVVADTAPLVGGVHYHGILARDAWIRPAAEKGVTAAYLTVQNTDHAADRLLSVHTAFADRVTLHETVVDGDVIRMDALDSVTVPAGAEVRFEPLGRHIMLSGLSRELKLGETVPLVLEFERLGTVDVPAVVANDPPSGPTVPTPAADLPPDDAVIRFVSPRPGATLSAGEVPIEVEVEGVPDPQIHWHLYVDGELTSMSVGPARESLVTLAPGDHELRAVLAGAVTHAESPNAPKDTIRIIVK